MKMRHPRQKPQNKQNKTADPAVDSSDFHVDDAFKPSKIEHHFEWIATEKTFGPSYNYIDYHFEMPDCYVRARTYLNAIHRVDLCGPFVTKNNLTTIEEKDFDDRIVRYFKRRFQIVEAMRKSGREQLWPPPEPKKRRG